MSWWSHIRGIITLDYDPSQPFVDISRLPIISGSERNAKITYHIDKTIGRLYVTLIGDLRDRSFKETLRETVSYLNRLSKRYFVKDVFVRVTNYDDEYIFDDSQWILDNFEIEEEKSNEH